MENEKKYFVIQYPLWEIDVSTLHDLYECLKIKIGEFCDLPVIMVPQGFQLCEMTKEQLLDMRDMMDYILEHKDDTDS